MQCVIGKMKGGCRVASNACRGILYLFMCPSPQIALGFPDTPLAKEDRAFKPAFKLFDAAGGAALNGNTGSSKGEGLPANGFASLNLFANGLRSSWSAPTELRMRGALPALDERRGGVSVREASRPGGGKAERLGRLRAFSLLSAKGSVRSRSSGEGGGRRSMVSVEGRERSSGATNWWWIGRAELLCSA